jgi:hypothetical protein
VKFLLAATTVSPPITKKELLDENKLFTDNEEIKSKPDKIKKIKPLVWEEIKTSTPLSAYIKSRRQIIALNTIVSSSLNYLIEQRTPLKDSKGNDEKESVLSTQYKNSFKDDEWYKTINSATPSKLAKRTLLQLVTLNKNLVENRLMLQRLLALQAAVAVQQIKGASSSLDTTERMLKTTIDKKIRSKMGVAKTKQSKAQDDATKSLGGSLD